MTARCDSSSDTFATGDERTREAIVAESIRLMKRAALERAVAIAKRAAEKRDAYRHDVPPTLEREYLRALQSVATAAETYLGTNDDDTKETDDHG